MQKGKLDYRNIRSKLKGGTRMEDTIAAISTAMGVGAI